MDLKKHRMNQHKDDEWITEMIMLKVKTGKIQLIIILTSLQTTKY